MSVEAVGKNWKSVRQSSWLLILVQIQLLAMNKKQLPSNCVYSCTRYITVLGTDTFKIVFSVCSMTFTSCNPLTIFCLEWKSTGRWATWSKWWNETYQTRHRYNDIQWLHLRFMLWVLYLVWTNVPFHSHFFFISRKWIYYDNIRGTTRAAT